MLEFRRRVKGRMSDSSKSGYRESLKKASNQGIEKAVSRERERAGAERDEKDRARMGAGKKRGWKRALNSNLISGVARVAQPRRPRGSPRSASVRHTDLNMSSSSLLLQLLARPGLPLLLLPACRLSNKCSRLFVMS